MTRQGPDLDKALEDPKAAYDTPDQVLSDSALDRAAKRAILESWERDARELSVAEDEGMGGGEQSMLQRVLGALETMSDGSTERTPAGNARHGGVGHQVPTNPAPTKHDARVKDRMLRLDAVVHVDQALEEAAVRMREAGVPFLPVVDGDEIVGVLTAQDLDAAPQHSERGMEAAKARDRLSTDVAYCFADDDLGTAAAVMDESGHHRLLVVDREGTLVGLLTRQGLETARAPAAGAGAKVARRHTRTPGRAERERQGSLASYGVKPRIRRRSG